MRDILRTPDTRFENLPGFNFSPHYRDDLNGFEGMRLHYLDEGPADAHDVFLCLHGEPTWCYLYRKMIPVFARAGHRVIAPDFFGFGRSDKPADDEVYTFDFHRNTLIALIETLDLRHITLVCQDWGGILGLTLPVHLPHRFSRLLVMNTTLGTGDYELTDDFFRWRAYVRNHPGLVPSQIIQMTCPHLSVPEIMAYDAPFPDDRYKSGVRRFPELVPDRPDAPGAEISRLARDWLRSKWDGPVFMAIGMQDTILGPEVMRPLCGLLRHCSDPIEHAEAGHFVQEWGEDVAREALKSFSE